LIEQCFTSPPTQYRLYGRRFLQVKRPNQQYQSIEGTYIAYGNRIDNTNGLTVSMLYSFQTFTLSLGKTVVPNHWTVFQHWADDR